MAVGYRLFRSKYSADDATGAYRAGGRWNAKGIWMLYCSSTLSLACLEVLVHIKEPRLPLDYAWVRIEVPDHLMDAPLEPGNLNESECSELGSRWAKSRTMPAVPVASVIIPTEHNLLLNPQHPEFKVVMFSGPTPFRFDPRLIKLGPVALE